MRQSTRVWAKFESMGKPNQTLVVNDTMYQVVMQLAEWLNEVYMGSHIRVVFARTESELERATAKWLRQTSESEAEPDGDMMHDLMELMGQQAFSLESPEDDSPKPDNSRQLTRVMPDGKLLLDDPKPSKIRGMTAHTIVLDDLGDHGDPSEMESD